MNTAYQERDVFEAIADPTRRKMIDLLANSEELPLHKLTPHFEMGRTAVSKHLTILKEANLVTNRRVGRETRYQFNAVPLQEIKEWVHFYEQFWTDRALLLKDILED
ncbi:ArsR/SmtB family transcription factor [Alkalicoccobacillus porphyridii]|uniref:Helix-turn-helix transcriptional regulator n=1 Tax=Alkalicoccobacillus porphyridii TaxID=2597270 RepID=A0A553ZVB8_9BACI|nr:metalloregulator ArsR/SmtB family transcription factor [Alkalicoccobacillus porphyridii]TSB45424.1 helix-turn-helix transcriptional regulator [Alkalicoccobacillus porphyridii]